MNGAPLKEGLRRFQTGSGVLPAPAEPGARLSHLLYDPCLRFFLIPAHVL